MKLFLKITREIDVSRAVCLWNTWDHEHLAYVHKQFGRSKILYEDSNVAIIISQFVIPFINIKLNTLHTLTCKKNGDVLVVDTMPFSIVVKLNMIFKEITQKKTQLINEYELYLPWYFYPFKKIITKLIKKWNNINWLEDMPLKKRRQLAIDMGFRDFHGIQNQSNASLVENNLKLPLPRSKNSILN